MFYLFINIFLKLFFILTAPLIYPIVYALRWGIRKNEVLLDNYLYKWRKGWFWLWIFLNDSEYLDGTYTEYGDSEEFKTAWKRLLRKIYRLKIK